MNPPPNIPRDVHCARDYETLARQVLAAPTYEYLAGGSGEDRTLRANRAAFQRHHPLPRLLRDVRAGHTRLTLAGVERPHPIFLAPLAYQRLAHEYGEIETARAAAATETPMILSCLSSYGLETVAQAAGPDRWFQLYFQPRREDTLDLARRAEAAGYTALVLTLDAQIQVPSRRALDAGFRLPADIHAANLAAYPALAPPPPAPGASRVFTQHLAHAPTWEDLDWLLAATRLPVWIKGVLHPDDARALQTRGVAGQIVSNHGGRGLDGAPASLEMLPAIRAAVGADHPLLFDGGIRSGGDIHQAIALGADAVLIGRLQIHALAVAGALGVAHLIKLLREELEITMAQCGQTSLQDIRADGLIPATPSAYTC